MTAKTKMLPKKERRMKEDRQVGHDEDADAYRTDDGKPPMEESQCNIASGDSKEDDET